MKILYVTPGCFDKGGISRYCRYQISALRDIFGASNVEALSLVGLDADGFESPFDVAWSGRDGGLWDKARLSLRAIGHAVAARPDVIHIAHVNLGPLAVGLSRLCGARTLLNVYGLEVWSGLPQRRLSAMRSIDRVIADCHSTGGYVCGAGMTANAPDVIWDCVDLDRFTPGECDPEILRKYGLPDKREGFVILSLGRLAKRAAHKGYDRLIEVVARVRRRHAGIRLVIAGQGDDRPRLEQLVDRFGLSDVVTFPGSISEDDLPEVYRSANLFSLVSDRGHGRGEGIPLTPLEAMSCGTPILVGNQDGSKEAVLEAKDGIANGFVIDPFDLDEHARLIVELAESADLLEKMALRARVVSEDAFGYARFVEQHRATYDNIFKPE
jgi:phosphatidylinositol alpha-1,6-mannosyltransferase